MPHDPPPTSDDGLLEQVREKLRPPGPKERHWAALAAAAFFAICAVVFALAAILAPPVSRDPAAKTGVR
ncbi:MAG: hypothetical protein WDN45_17585 [Caulobacteraceae bacterium]